jgi:hypothetical protein
MPPARGPGETKRFCDRICARASREYYRQLPEWAAEMGRLKKMRRTTKPGYLARLDAEIAILGVYIGRKGQRP